MAIERHRIPDDDLRRRAARLAESEARLAQRERDVAAREAELECGAIDRRLRRLALGTGTRAQRIATAARNLAPAAAGLWLMAFPLAFAGERGPLQAAALIAGAALAFLALARARFRAIAVLADWALGAIGTWLLAWGGLGLATTGAGWALAVTGAAVWMTALAPAGP
jgi:hypothetical protein